MCKGIVIYRQYYLHTPVETFINKPTPRYFKTSLVLQCRKNKWPASCEKGPSDICKKCRPRPAAASPTQRLIRLCILYRCLSIDCVEMFSISRSGWSGSTLCDMSEGPFSCDACQKQPIVSDRYHTRTTTLWSFIYASGNCLMFHQVV